MRWSEEYATGVARVDEDHKMIFRMAADYRAALDAGQGRAVYPDFLDSLFLYCRGHFGFEEQCMSELRCPVARKNKDAHADFLEVLSEFKERYAANGYDEIVARSLTDNMEEWLANHICNVDIHLKRCVQRRAADNDS